MQTAKENFEVACERFFIIKKAEENLIYWLSLLISIGILVVISFITSHRIKTYIHSPIQLIALANALLSYEIIFTACII